MNQLKSGIVPAGLRKPTTISFRVYGLLGLQEGKTNILLKMLEDFFRQSVGIYRNSIIIHAELPAAMSSATFFQRLEELQYQLSLAVSLGLGFDIEFCYSRM